MMEIGMSESRRGWKGEEITSSWLASLSSPRITQEGICISEGSEISFPS